MDLKYYDNDQWVSLKAVCGVESVEDTSASDDSTFATPNYITNKIITKDDNLIKYYDGTILNKEVKLDDEVVKKSFVSDIELNEENGTIKLTPTYGEIEDNEKGNFVSDISFENGDLKIKRENISSDILNPISSGPTIPNEYTKGFFYLQIEESGNSDPSA